MNKSASAARLKKPVQAKGKLFRREAIAGYCFLLPNFLGFTIFIAIPVIMGFIVSFTDYNGFSGSFVGIENYLRLFRDSQFKTALVNNLLYTLATVPLTIVFALCLAMLLNKALFMGSVFKTVYFFPHLTSMVAIGCIALMVFEPQGGIVNQMLSFFGVGADNLPKWFASSKTALITVAIVVIWKSAGYYMIMFLGGLKTIPSQLYEAAVIDGANRWQTFKNITWPMLSPTTFMVIILATIESFKVFDIIKITTDGGPGRATSVLSFRIYTEAFVNMKMGYGSAIAYFLFLIIFIVTLVQWRGQKNWVNE